MNLNLPIFILLITALVFSIIELGLSAYFVSVTANRFYSNQVYDYLLFCSIWSLLVAGFLLVWGYMARGKSPNAKHGSERWLAPVTLALNLVTMVFWLAAFASLANMYNNYNPQGVAGAQMAFAVMLWLVFMALSVLNFLTAFGVYKSDRAGHSRMFSRVRVDGVRTYETTETSRTDM